MQISHLICIFVNFKIRFWTYLGIAEAYGDVTWWDGAEDQSLKLILFLSQNMQISHLICIFANFKNRFWTYLGTGEAYGDVTWCDGAEDQSLNLIIFSSQNMQISYLICIFVNLKKCFWTYLGTADAYGDVTWWDGAKDWSLNLIPVSSQNIWYHFFRKICKLARSFKWGCNLMGWCSIPGEIHTSSMDGITFARRSHTAEPKNREILVSFIFMAPHRRWEPYCFSVVRHFRHFRHFRHIRHFRHFRPESYPES